jgi:hypothetical protein
LFKSWDSYLMTQKKLPKIHEIKLSWIQIQPDWETQKKYNICTGSDSRCAINVFLKLLGGLKAFTHTSHKNGFSVRYNVCAQWGLEHNMIIYNCFKTETNNYTS